MRSGAFFMGVAGIGLSSIATFDSALAQKNAGILYALHSAPSGACPGLDWHITVTGDTLEGFVGVNHTKRVWRLEGTVAPASSGKERTFEMDASEVGGAERKAVVKGTSGGEYVHAAITGAGTPCDGKTLSIPRVINGTGGGGG